MPLNSLTIENLNKEFLCKFQIIQLQIADARYACGYDSEQEEECQIQIYKLSLEYKERIKMLS